MRTALRAAHVVGATLEAMSVTRVLRDQSLRTVIPASFAARQPLQICAIA